VSDEASGAEACLYVISCRLDRVRIGVAGDAEKRLRELQVGSPVELKLALTRPYAERRDADAVAEELYRYFASRRVRGSWYRLTAADVRERLGQRATLEAPDRARAAAETAAREHRVAPGLGEKMRARTQKQLAYERRRRQERTRKQKRAAKLLAQGMTQQAVAAELGVTTRTLRNWKAAPALQRELERQHKHTGTSERRRRPASPSRTPV
jgi:DNA-binding transcriptional regulator YiaG